MIEDMFHEVLRNLQQINTRLDTLEGRISKLESALDGDEEIIFVFEGDDDDNETREDN